MIDQDWLRDSIQAEAECDFDLQIGGGRLPEYRPIDPLKLQQARNQIKLYSLLYGELKRLLAEVDFGSGMEAAYTQGRQCIFERMQTITEEQRSELDALLPTATTLPVVQFQSQLRRQIDRLLTPSDWQRITAAAGAAMAAKLLEQVAGVQSSSPPAMY